MSPQYKRTWLINIVLGLLLPLSTRAQGGIVNTSGTYLLANGGVYLVINDAGFKNDGTFTAGSGTISFTGNTATANSFISGLGSTAFYNLTLNKTANGIQLNRNISVTNNLIFTSGDSLFLNNYNIDLGSTGSINGETNSKRITGLTGGYIQITRSLNAPSAINPGNIGLEITSSADLGSTVIQRGHRQQSGTSVYRYFDVTPANNSGLDATANFYYYHSELAGVGEGNLGMFSSSNGGTNWTNLGENGLNLALDFVTKNGIDGFNRLTLSDISQPLSVSLLYLKARLVNQQTILTWATATESDNDHFEIEHSIDGRNFTILASVNGAGNSNSTRSYEYIDIHPVTGINYYRLKQVDVNGHFTFSKLVLVKLSQNGDAFLTVHPNPAQQRINIILTSARDEDCRMELFDVKGILVGAKKIHITTGVNELEWDINALSAGIYTIKISGTLVTSIHFIKGNN